MRKFGLVGYPLGHSFSKQYFADKFLDESIPDCSYENFELKTVAQLHELILSDREICGLNITIPHKTDILKYIDVADNEALEVGAVNVLKISSRNGRRVIKGFNTDIFGFEESLSAYLQGGKIKSAIVLGTGGSSKAVSYVLKKLGMGIIHVSRMPGSENISYPELTDEIISENKLIVNTTPVGMFPDNDSYPIINYKCLTDSHILFDLVYNPVITSFLKKGKERGSKTIGGLTMLHLQAEKSWEIWNDINL
jgi:shikimate dehydrogenase